MAPRSTPVREQLRYRGYSQHEDYCMCILYMHIVCAYFMMSLCMCILYDAYNSSLPLVSIVNIASMMYIASD